MGVEKVLVRPGNGTDFPKKNDEVSVEYTGTTIILPRYSQGQHLTIPAGWLFDETAPGYRGDQ